MVGLLAEKCIFEDKKMHLDTAIHYYIQSLINYLNTGDIEKIKFINYEF